MILWVKNKKLTKNLACYVYTSCFWWKLEKRMKCDNILLESCVKRNFPNVKIEESLDGNGLGKVQEGLFMREVSWPSPPQQYIQKIHKFEYTNKIHKYKYTNTGGVPRTQRQITANACYQAVIQIITVPPYPDHSSCYQYAYSNLVKILNQWKSEKGWMQIQNLIKPWGRWGENLRGILLLGPDSSDKKTH